MLSRSLVSSLIPVHSLASKSDTDMTVCTVPNVDYYGRYLRERAIQQVYRNPLGTMF
jgi:hypothetical protein